MLQKDLFPPIKRSQGVRTLRLLEYFYSIETRKRKFDKTGKRQRKRKFKQDLSYIKDEDVRREVAKGAKLISYSES